MSINFPSSPYIGQITTTGSNTWRWDGVKWSIVSSVGFQGSSGFQGTVGFQGSTGFQSSLGFQGSFGFQGSPGFQGTVGFQGSSGFQGTVGFQGSPGFQGTVGFQGSFGFQGSPGFQGSFGFQGCVGFQGSLAIANVAVADTPPPFANNGYLWLDTSSGNLNIYYGPNNVWISVTSVGIQGTPGFKGSTGDPGGATGYAGSVGVTTLPLNVQSVSYVLQPTDNGSLVATTANVTVNAGVFYNGQNVTLFNNTSANVSIIANTGVTFYLAGSSSTGNRILQTRGLSTLVCVNTNTFVVTGAGVV